MLANLDHFFFNCVKHCTLYMHIFIFSDIELNQAMARRQSHLWETCRIPGTYHDSAILWSILDGFNHVDQLLNTLTCVINVQVHILGSQNGAIKNHTPNQLSTVGLVRRWESKVEELEKFLLYPLLRLACARCGGVKRNLILFPHWQKRDMGVWRRGTAERFNLSGSQFGWLERCESE